jgi:hypothetical protein
MKLRLQEAETRVEEAEERADDAERDFVPVAFPVALARIKDCSSTALPRSRSPHHDQDRSRLWQGPDLLARERLFRAPAHFAVQLGNAGRTETNTI